MSKKLCKDEDDISVKRKGRKNRYICTKCDKKSPKEKWLCYASPIEKKKKNKKG